MEKPTHGHELRGRMLVGEGYRTEGNKGERKLDKFNSIINKKKFKEFIKVIWGQPLKTSEEIKQNNI